MRTTQTEQRVAGRELDAEIAQRVMGLSLDVPRERALAIVGVTFVAVTGRTFTVDYGDGDEYLPMPAGDELPGHPSDDNWNQRYFRHVAQKGIERGGERAAKIERMVSEVRKPTPNYSTDIAAAWLVLERLQRDERHTRATLTCRTFTGFTYGYCTSDDPDGNRYIDGWTCELRDCGPVGWATVELGAPTAPLAICLAALASISGSRTPEQEER